MKRVIAVPDLHFPFHNAKALSKLYDAVANFKPDAVVQLGDLLDHFAHSKFARTQDLMTPKQEIEEGRGAAEAFWKNIRQAASPKTKLYQIKGNHDARPIKRIYEKYPEIASLVDLGKLYRFPNVETMDCERTELKIDGVYYVHGWLSGIGRHATYFDAPVVHGHTHRAGVHFFPRRGRLIFELDCGFLADGTSRPLAYSPTLTTQWVTGYGEIDHRGPRFCPL